MKPMLRTFGLLVAALALFVVGLAGCGDDDSGNSDRAVVEETAAEGEATSGDAVGSEDDGSTSALSAAKVENSQLVIEVPAAAPSFVLTADVPSEWKLSAADGGELGFDSDSWELFGPDREPITVTVYDTRNTSYADKSAPERVNLSTEEIAWDQLYQFTGEQLGPPRNRNLIANTEEVEVPTGFPGFDLRVLLEVNEERASIFVLSLDGSFFVTFTSPSSIDADTTTTLNPAYTEILGTATVVAT